MRYFINVVNFVDEHLPLIVMLFLATCAIEMLVFVIRKFKFKTEFETENFLVAIASTLVILLGAYVVACLGVGFVNCIKDQDWNFWENYLGFFKNIQGVVFAVAYIGSFIYFMAKFSGIDSLGGRLIASGLAAIFGGGVVAGVIFLAGFLIYLIVAILIIIIKLIWFVISGFFTSIYQFIIKYWYISVSSLVVPGCIYGAYCALANYIRTFRTVVLHKNA